MDDFKNYVIKEFSNDKYLTASDFAHDIKYFDFPDVSPELV